MVILLNSTFFAEKSEDKQAQPKFVPPPSQPVFPGQLSPTVSTPQFDISGFDTSVFDSSTQGKTDNESSDLGKSIDKTFDSDAIKRTLDKMSAQFFGNQDPVSVYKAQYARAESLFKLGRPPGLFFCKFCGKVMQNKSVYEYHVRTHTGEKPFKCDVCNRHFAGRQPLETHQRLHTGERPFSCDICNKSFTARSGRDYHRRKHHINMINEYIATPSLQPDEINTMSRGSEPISTPSFSDLFAAAHAKESVASPAVQPSELLAAAQNLITSRSNESNK